jgi:hypothetical protein
MTFVNLADLTDPSDPAGRSYREVNAERPHNIALGSLVELESGVRLFVVHQGRDCDQTPLYSLAPDPEDVVQADPRFGNPKWINGYSEDGLKVIRPGKAP